TAKAKLAGMWREKVDQHNTGSPVYERIERIIIERPPQSAPGNIPDESTYDEESSIPRCANLSGYRRKKFVWLPSEEKTAPVPGMIAFDELLSNSTELPQVELSGSDLAQIVYTSNRKLAGIISIGDVVKHRLDDLELEA